MFLQHSVYFCLLLALLPPMLAMAMAAPMF